MIGEAEFPAMKPNAVVINVGRGPVIDEAAMVRALSEKRIKGAALDVFDTEPLPDGHPFYSLENVLLSPHCADHTPIGRSRPCVSSWRSSSDSRLASRWRMWWIRSRGTKEKLAADKRR